MRLLKSLPMPTAWLGEISETDTLYARQRNQCIALHQGNLHKSSVSTISTTAQTLTAASWHGLHYSLWTLKPGGQCICEIARVSPGQSLEHYCCAAQMKLKECEEVLENDYFLAALKDDFVENARLFIFETYCRIHQCIDMRMLAGDTSLTNKGHICALWRLLSCLHP